MQSIYAEWFNVVIPTDYEKLDKKLIKKSHTRCVVSGDFYELYKYENPYFYNKSPSNGKPVDRGNADEQRRDDNLFACRQRVRRLINSNINQYNERTKFITYTFKENVTDLSRANTIWRHYCKRLQRKLSDRKIKYLLVVEFQKRGAVHYHVLYFNFPYLANAGEKLEKLWGQGSVNVKAISSVKNVGAYVCKYLQKGTLDKRLVGEKAFFTSRNLLQPLELKSESSIAKFLQGCIVTTEVERSYSSTLYGKINYIQGELIQKK